ncbi:MAG: hypothetical protein ACI87J_001964 [Colwellia sp.]|jgi:hypothetical protein
MLGTTVSLDELLESLSKPLIFKLRALGVKFCDRDLSNFISTNFDYALDYSPTAFSYFKIYSDHLDDLSEIKNKPAVGHRVTYTDHKGTLHSQALIVSIIRNKVKVCEVSNCPTLSLVGNNKNHKVVISSDDLDNTRLIDISCFHVTDIFNTTFLFKTDPLIQESTIKIATNMLRWRLE